MLRTKENLIKMLVHMKTGEEEAFEQKLQKEDLKLSERIWRSHRDMKFDAWRTVYDLRKTEGFEGFRMYNVFMYSNKSSWILGCFVRSSSSGCGLQPRYREEVDSQDGVLSEGEL